MQISLHSGVRVFVTMCLLGALPGALPASAAPGFKVREDKILDARGNVFLMRGINHSHAWDKSHLDSAFNAIPATGANVLRVALSNGKRWTRDDTTVVKKIIALGKQHKMALVLEVHDCTGYPEQSGSVTLSTAVDYWISIKGVLVGQEAYVIVNIANEAFGNDSPIANYVSEHKTAIARLREAGFRHALMVDAPNWGQDWQNSLRTRAGEILGSDPDSNVIFSVHMYDVFNTEAKVNTYLQGFKTDKRALVVGEFAADHGSGKPVAAEAILRRTRHFDYGYMGWSWKGNGSGLGTLDIAVNWNGTPLSSWGQLLVNDSNGIRATARAATVFDPEPASLRRVDLRDRPTPGFRAGSHAFTVLGRKIAEDALAPAPVRKGADDAPRHGAPRLTPRTH